MLKFKFNVILRPTHRFNHFGYLTYEHEHGVTFPLPIPGTKQETDMKSTSLCVREVSVRKCYTCKLLFLNFMFEFPCIISLYYIKNKQDATLAVCLLVTAR
jgi:hypothetical protein